MLVQHFQLLETYFSSTTLRESPVSLPADKLPLVQLSSKRSCKFDNDDDEYRPLMSLNMSALLHNCLVKG